jgi:sugar diacid utilization regulator/putative methionine-R-sulfoxide reductase with GAF domain
LSSISPEAAAALVAAAVPAGPEAVRAAIARAAVELGLRAATDTGAEIAAMRTVAARVLAARELDEGLFAVTHEALGLLRADMAGVFLVDDEQLVMRACVGNRELVTARLRMRRGQGLAGHVFATGAAAKVDDYLNNDVISGDFHSLAVAESTRSAMCAPLMLDGEIIGALEVWRRRETPFVERDIASLVGLAELAAIALHHSRLYDERAASLREVEIAHRVLETQFSKVTHALSLQQELLQALLDGERLSGVLRIVAARTKASVVLFDTDLDVLAGCPTTLDTATLGTAVRTALRTQTPSVRGTSWAGFDRQTLAVRPVHVGGDLLGWLCMLNNASTNDEQTELSLTQAALACALHHLEEQAAARARSALRDEVLLSLLSGPVDERRAAATRAKHVNVDLRGELRACVCTFGRLAEIGEAEGWTTSQAERVRRRLLAVCEGNLATTGWLRLAARHGDTVVTLLRSVDVEELRGVLQRNAEELDKEAPGIGAGWAVSAPRGNPMALAEAYAEACTALRALGQASDRRVVFHEELGILGLLLAGPGSLDLPRFVIDTIGPALTYDRTHGTALVETLRAFLDADCSQQETAARLFVHQKTVKYRLAALQKLTGLDLRHHHDRMRADIAVRVADLG